MKESSFADTEQDNNADMSLEYDMDEKVLDISALHDENDAATLENLDELIQQLNDESFIEPGLVQSEECSFWTALWDNSDLYNGVEEEILLSVVSSDDISDDEQEQQEYENDWAANDNHELSILSEIDSAEEMAELNLSKIWDSEHHPLALHGRLLEPSVQASFQFLPRTADSGCFNDAQTGQHQPEQENQELKWDGELHPMALCDGLAASFLSLARNSDTRHYDAQANQQKQVPQKHMVEWDGECHPMALCHGLNEQSLQGDCMSRARKGDLAKLLMLKQTNYNQSPRNKN